MKPLSIAGLSLCFVLSNTVVGQAQDIDTELQKLAEILAKAINENGKKKIAVVDFTDLQGSSQGELGKYIAEQLTIDLVMTKRDFSVLDRANLSRILVEHQLTATGLVDPSNAKKLGQFAGVDAFILGTILPKGNRISLNTKLLTTDTAEIPAAARAEFETDDAVRFLTTKPAVTEKSHEPPKEPTVIRSLGKMVVELQSLRVMPNGEYLLTLSLTNQSKADTFNIALAMNTGSMNHPLKSVLTDPEGFEFHSNDDAVAGIAVGDDERISGYNGRVTSIRPGQTISATIKFSTRPGRAARRGKCHLQLRFLAIEPDGYGGVKRTYPKDLLADLNAK